MHPCLRTSPNLPGRTGMELSIINIPIYRHPGTWYGNAREAWARIPVLNDETREEASNGWPKHTLLDCNAQTRTLSNIIIMVVSELGINEIRNGDEVMMRCWLDIGISYSIALATIIIHKKDCPRRVAAEVSSVAQITISTLRKCSPLLWPPACTTAASRPSASLPLRPTLPLRIHSVVSDAFQIFEVIQGQKRRVS